MKRKFYYRSLWIMLATILLLYACKRTETDIPEILNSKANIEQKTSAKGKPIATKGWLNFLTLDDFKTTLQALQKMQNENKAFEDWERLLSQTGFTSLRKYYEQIDADVSEDRTALTVDSLIRTNRLLDCPDDLFATVLSKNGFIQIADTVYSFKLGQKNGEAYAVPARYADELLNGIPPSKLAGSVMHLSSFIHLTPFPRWAEVGEVGHGPINVEICNYPSGLMPNWWGQSGGDIYKGDNGVDFPEHNGRKVKLNYHRWRVGYIFYASAGIRLKMWKHTRFAGWQSVTNADQMIMESCCKGKIFIPGIPLISFNEKTTPAWPQFSKMTENSFEKTMKWTASGLSNEIFLEHFNFHFKVNYRGRIVERSIRQ